MDVLNGGGGYSLKMQLPIFLNARLNGISYKLKLKSDFVICSLIVF